MSAILDEFLSKRAKVNTASIAPFPNSKKIYVQGSRGDIQVPMREIAVSDTQTNQGIEKNPSITVYDTSGPYSDPTQHVDIRKGLTEIRRAWIEERADTEILNDFSSSFGLERAAKPELAHLRFEHFRKPRRAKAGANVTQMHYACRGIITPEMEYVAI
ncbi:MAG: phosphomethylpyrimidine synthase ThiC, partial [Gammaproteobacteria bacterium]|nr:phosphomethylpyrimidine synthase ThiC [Gammaproteobacteria bacterium]